MKRIVLLSGGLVILLAIMIGRFHSSPPGGWTAVRLGEPRMQVIRNLGTSESDQRVAKGFELWNSKTTSYMAAVGRWQILVTYDADDKVSWKEIRFVPFESSGFNDKIPDRLLYRIKTSSVRRTQ
jgi:hypothetical protein